jgi:hypothetical protein
MKKLLVLSLVLALTLLTAGSTIAAAHNFNGDFWSPNLMPDSSNIEMPEFEGWYYIEKDTPSGAVRGKFGDDNALGAEFFQNDQTFANLYFNDPENGSSVSYLKGSYLWDNQFFVGLDLGDSQITFAPGFRYDLDDNCYIAASLDYAVNDEYSEYQDSGLIDMEINGRYYTDLIRVYGQLVLPNEDVASSADTFLLVGGAYKYADNIIVGANLVTWGNYHYLEAGCSTTFDKAGAELRFIDDDGETKVDCNLLYSFTDNIRAGLETYKVEGVADPYIIIKGRYTLDDQNSAILMYQLKNESKHGDDGVFYLGWDLALK